MGINSGFKGLKALKDCQCPRNLYNLTRNYFSDRSAVISTNSMKIETTVNKGFPKGPAVDQGTGIFSIIHY